MGNIRSERRRQKILEYAKPIFLEHGYRDTRIDEIVSAAGGSKQSIYLHFGSKKGLYEAIIHEMAKEAEIDFSLDSCKSESISATLRDFSESYLNHVLSEDVVKLLRVIISHSNIDKAGANLFRRFGPEEHYGQLSKYFDHLVEQKRLHVPDTYLAAKQFLATLRADMQIRALTNIDYRPTQVEISESINTAVDGFINAYS